MNATRPSLLAAALLIAGAASATFVAPPAAAQDAPRVLIVGGGADHDFDRWYRQADSATLANAGFRVRYTDDPQTILGSLAQADVLFLANNQPLPGDALREGILDFVRGGGGLLLGHAANWYSWRDWPEFNRDVVGGGARSHGRYGEFEVTIVDREHPVTATLPATFRLRDELYRHERDEAGPLVHVLATGTEPNTGTVYPVAWTHPIGAGRVVSITLGHDGGAHELDEYRTLLRNAVRWLADPAASGGVSTPATAAPAAGGAHHVHTGHDQS
jgi:uncharacterized protein